MYKHSLKKNALQTNGNDVTVCAMEQGDSLQSEVHYLISFFEYIISDIELIINTTNSQIRSH